MAVGPGAENSTGWMRVVEVGTWSHANVCEGPLVPGHWSGHTVHLGGSVSQPAFFSGFTAKCKDPSPRGISADSMGQPLPGCW